MSTIPATKSKTTTHIGTALSFIIAASLVIFSMITGKATVIWVCILGIPTLVLGNLSAFMACRSAWTD